MRSRRSVVIAVTAVVLGVVAGLGSPVAAGPPGSWTVISGGGLSNIVEPGMYRTADGTLHVAIVRENPNFTESIDVAHISESGKLLGRTTVIDQWAGVTSDPELVGSPSGGMRLVFGGQRTTVTGATWSPGTASRAGRPAGERRASCRAARSRRSGSCPRRWPAWSAARRRRPSRACGTAWANTACPCGTAA